MELSELEWAVLESIAYALCENLVHDEVLTQYWTTGATLVKQDVDLLKKLANYNE